MTKAKFNQLCNTCLEKLKSLAPKDTGNLAYNAIRGEYVDENTFTIYINESIAPYMPYTNEPWVAERWKGKTNPNEEWFQNAAQVIAELIAELSNGELK